MKAFKAFMKVWGKRVAAYGVAAAMLLTGVGITATANALETGVQTSSSDTKDANVGSTDSAGQALTSSRQFSTQSEVDKEIDKQVAAAEKAGKITHVSSDNIDHDTVWEGIVIASSVTIAPNVTLTVKPGTIVKFFSIDVQGTLRVEGEAGNRPVLTSANDYDIISDEIVMPGNTISTSISIASGGSVSIDNAIFRYTHVGGGSGDSVKSIAIRDSDFSKDTYGLDGLFLRVDDVQDSLELVHNTISPDIKYESRSYITALVWADVRSTTASVDIENNYFNLSYPWNNNPYRINGIQLYGGDSQHDINLTVKNNTFNGIYADLVSINSFNNIKSDDFSGNTSLGASQSRNISFYNVHFSGDVYLPWKEGNAVPYLSGYNSIYFDQGSSFVLSDGLVRMDQPYFADDMNIILRSNTSGALRIEGSYSVINDMYVPKGGVHWTSCPVINAAKGSHVTITLVTFASCHQYVAGTWAQSSEISTDEAASVVIAGNEFNGTKISAEMEEGAIPEIYGNTFNTNSVNGFDETYRPITVSASKVNLNRLADNELTGKFKQYRALTINGISSSNGTELVDDATLPLEGDLVPNVSSLEIPSGKTLTMRAGAIVKGSITVATGGSLLAQGSTASPAVFTSQYDNTVGGVATYLSADKFGTLVTAKMGSHTEFDHVVFKEADTGLFMDNLSATVVTNSKFVNLNKAVDSAGTWDWTDEGTLEQQYNGHLFKLLYDAFSPINCEPPFSSMVFMSNVWFGKNGYAGGYKDLVSSLVDFPTPESAFAKWEKGNILDKDASPAEASIFSKIQSQRQKVINQLYGQSTIKWVTGKLPSTTNTIPWAQWSCSVTGAGSALGGMVASEDLDLSFPYTPVMPLNGFNILAITSGNSNLDFARDNGMLTQNVDLTNLTILPIWEWLGWNTSHATIDTDTYTEQPADWKQSNADLSRLTVRWARDNSPNSWCNKPEQSVCSVDSTGSGYYEYDLLGTKFSPGTTEYTLNAPADVKNIEFRPDALYGSIDDEKTTGKESLFNWFRYQPLKFGNNKVTIVVNSPDGKSSKTYTIHVKRADDDGDVEIKSITPSRGTMSYDFNTGTYTWTVPKYMYDASADFFEVKPSNPKAVFSFKENSHSNSTDNCEYGICSLDTSGFDDNYSDPGLLTVTTPDGSWKTFRIIYKVQYIGPKYIGLRNSQGADIFDDKVTIAKGSSYKITADIQPDDAIDKSVTWSSSNDKVASVDADGNVTALTAGTATITVTSNKNKKITASVTIIVTASTQYRTVTFDANGGMATATKQQVEDGKTVTKPTDPTRDGYKFTGWTTDRDGKNAYDFATPVTGDLTLFAQWKDSQAPTITGGGDVTIQQGETFDPITGITASDNADGDLTKSITLTITDANGNAIDSIDTSHPGTYTLTYAVSDKAGNAAKPLVRKLTVAAVTHTVTFDTNGGSAITPQQVADGGTVNEPAAPTRAGYTFDGWYTAKDDGDRVVFPAIVNADVTYFAHWTKQTDIKPVSIDDVKATIIQGQTPTLPKTVTVHYSDGTAKTVSVTWNEPNWASVKPGDVTVNGTVDGVNGLTAKAVVTVAADTSAPVIDVPQDQRNVTIKVGEKFDLKAAIMATDNALGNVTDRIKIAIADASGKTVDTIDTTKSGAYTITYTVADAAGNESTVIRTLVVEATTHMVTFDANGGSAVAAATVEDGKQIAAPSEPTRDGYTFAGWTTDREGKSAYDFSKPVTGDLMLFAQWKAKENKPGDNGDNKPGEKPGKPGTDQPSDNGNNGENKPGSWNPLPGDKLTDGNRGTISVTDGNATAGKTYRLYLTGLAECFAQVDAGRPCALIAYIYSDPVRLLAADGKANTVNVHKDGRDYYVEVTIPAEYSGDHRIALYDEQGGLIGWSPVRVVGDQKQSGNPQGSNTNPQGDGQQGGDTSTQQNTDNAKKQQIKRLTNTGASVAAITVAGMLLLAGAVVLSVVRRSRD